MTRGTLGTLAAIVLLAILAVGTVGAVGRASADATERRVRAEMRDSVAFVAASAFRASRDSMDVLHAATLSVERKLAKVRTDARATLAATGRVIDSLRLAFGDTEHDSVTGAAPSDSVPRPAFGNVGPETGTTSLTVPSSSLTVAIAAYDSLAAAFRAYLAADAIAHETLELERGAMNRTLARADTALAAMTQARDAWREAATCRTVFGIRCPTRTQVAVGASIVTLAAARAVRR